MTKVIRIDDDLYEILKSYAVPFEDTPSDALRRILHKTNIIGSDTPQIEISTTNISNQGDRSTIMKPQQLSQVAAEMARLLPKLPPASFENETDSKSEWSIVKWNAILPAEVQLSQLTYLDPEELLALPESAFKQCGIGVDRGWLRCNEMPYRQTALKILAAYTGFKYPVTRTEKTHYRIWAVNKRDDKTNNSIGNKTFFTVMRKGFID